MNAEELESALDLKIDGKTEEGHSHTTFYGSYNGEKVVIKHSDNKKVPREIEALELMEEKDIPTPEILDYKRVGCEHILLTRKIESSFPDREMWKDYGFCLNFAKSAAEILNKIHSKKVNKRAKKKKNLIENKDRASRNLSSKMDKIRRMHDGEIPEIVEIIKEKISSDHGFAHGDFTTENILINGDEISGIIDWADSGITSQTRDVALFESSYIDEYVRIFHPQKVEELREKFRSIVEFDSTEKLELYRFHQNVVILAYIRSGGCSHEWQSVGSIEEVKEHREKVLREDIGKVKQILEEI
jgi:aminoglycoside phosphotransferase (APT) family kinase protein